MKWNTYSDYTLIDLEMLQIKSVEINCLFSNYFANERKQLSAKDLYNIAFPNEVEEIKRKTKTILKLTKK